MTKNVITNITFLNRSSTNTEELNSYNVPTSKWDYIALKTVGLDTDQRESHIFITQHAL